MKARHLTYSLFPRDAERVPNDKAMLKALLAAPSDTATWNVYSDLLLDHGQDGRADFVRRWHALATNAWTKTIHLLAKLVVRAGPLAGSVAAKRKFAVSSFETPGRRYLLNVELDHDACILHLSVPTGLGPDSSVFGRRFLNTTSPTIRMFFRTASMLFNEADAEFLAPAEALSPKETA